MRGIFILLAIFLISCQPAIQTVPTKEIQTEEQEIIVTAQIEPEKTEKPVQLQEKLDCSYGQDENCQCLPDMKYCPEQNKCIDKKFLFWYS
jgi:hypothetical protein